MFIKIRKVAEDLGCSPDTVERWMAHLIIDTQFGPMIDNDDLDGYLETNSQ